MLTWLDVLCRKMAEGCDEKHHNGDPRRAMAWISSQIVIAAQNGKLPFDNKIDDAFHTMLTPFVAPYLPADAALTFSDGQPFDRGLGIILTRQTASLLTATKNPEIHDDMWRDKIGARRGIYVDVPHGSFPFRTDAGKLLQIRAILAAPYLPPDMPGHTLFFVQITEPGSERGVGRILGVLTPEGLIAPLGNKHGIYFGDVELFSQTDTELRDFVLNYAGTFLRMVLCYYLFGPREIREELIVTPAERLNKGKPRNGQSLFAMTRLHPSESMGRAQEDAPVTWSLSERQEVTGHFKLQAYGPGFSQRRMIWVSGYERGPDDVQIRPKGVRV